MVTINANSPSSTSTVPTANHIAANESTAALDPYSGFDGEYDNAEDANVQQELDEQWPTGGTASDPEAEGGRERAVGVRKKRVRWIMDKHANEELSPTISATPGALYRRRTRSLSGDELFNSRHASSRDIMEEAAPKPTTPIVTPPVPQLPVVEGGWQTTPFSPSSGVPTIIRRPTIEELSKDPAASAIKSALNLATFLSDTITTSPLTLPTLSIDDSDHVLNQTSTSSTSVHPASESPQRQSGLPDIPAELPTAPSSPLFPPLPTPSSSLITNIPKFTPPPNLLQSPRSAMSRTISKDRSSDFSSSPRISPNTELHKQPQIQDAVFKSALSPSSRFSRPAISSHHALQQHPRPNNRRQLAPSSSASSINAVSHQPTQPSPPKLTTSPRSPVGYSLSPHTPQSTMLSPAPLPSISIMEDHDFAVPIRPESPPWQMVGSGAGLTSPRMKGTHWRTEVINNSAANLIKSPPVTPFSSVHLQIDELPNEGDSDHESLRPPHPSPHPSPHPTVPLTPLSVASEASPRPAILSPSPPKLLELMPSTPPFKAMDDVPLDQDQMDRILQEAHVPWQSKGKEILPVRKIVKRTERGEWEEGLTVDDIPRESAHWKLVQAQRLWLKGNQEFFKLKHPCGLPRDHKTPKIQYVDGGEALRAIELIVQSILLDARVLAFKTLDARKDFMEQLAWQFYADARHAGWPELVNIDYDLDEMFAKAGLRVQGRGQFAQGGVIGTRRSLASFIRNHVILATLEEEEGLTQSAVIRYGRALDIIDWVNQELGPAPDKNLYGRGDSKQRIEPVFEGVFGRGVQIRLGLTLISQYNHIKQDPACSSLRVQMLEELSTGARNLFESFEANPMSPYVKKDLTLDVYISDYVYHLAYAFLFKGFYGKENAKLLFDMDQPSPVGGTSAVEIARRRSKSSAQDLAQAGLLFPEDEEERIQCFELALEEILKVGGLRVGEARAMYRSLKEFKVITDRLWNHPADDGDDEAEDVIGLFDDGTTAAKKKKKKNKKKGKKDPTESAESAGGDKTIPPINDLATPKPSSPSTLLSPLPVQTPRVPASPPSTLSPHSLLLERWFTALQRNQDEKRIMSGDVLHPARNLRGKPEVVWEEVVEDGGDMDGDSIDGNIPWASWGMKSVKATKWEDLIKEEATEPWKSGRKGRRATKNPKIENPLPVDRHNAESKKLDIQSDVSKSSPSPNQVTVPTNSTAGSSPTKSKKIVAIDESPTKAVGVSPYILFETSLSSETRQRRSFDMWSLSSVLAEVDAANSPKSIESVQRDVKPAARHWDRPTPWAVIARISKLKFFSLDLDVFDGNNVKN